MKLGFVGLGVMGYPMAGHLQRAGHQVTVFNRTHSKAQRWVDEYAGQAAQTPRETAADAAMVFVCVGNDQDVRQIVLGTDGVLAGMDADTVLVDHTTTSAGLAKELAAVAAEADVGFIDAPVSGGQVGAENGQLTVMCGGEVANYQRVASVIAAYSRKAARLGDVGCGQLTKSVNQICIAGLVQGLAEGLNFARRVGLDPTAVVEVVAQGAAQSWQMDNRHATMITGDYEHGFAVDLMRKDLGIAMAEARDVGAELPVTEVVDAFYAEVQELGGGRWDTSSLLARLVDRADS